MDNSILVTSQSNNYTLYAKKKLITNYTHEMKEVKQNMHCV